MSTVNLNIVRATKEGNNQCLTPSDILEDALTDIAAGDKTPSKAMVLFLEEDELQFSTSWYAANMKSSEMLALLEMIKSSLLRDMGLT